MAREFIQDRLLPSLLDRLTDHQPELEKESVEFKVLSIQQLRSNVLRDLSWLLNATSNTLFDSSEIDKHVQGSVINFGIPALSGAFLSGISLKDLRQRIKECIATFEPRIIPNSIQVTTKNESSISDHNVVVFTIKAQLWAQPAPIELLINSQIDLETGQTKLAEASK